MSFFAPLEAATHQAKDEAELGGKARSLRRLRAAGLPVPRGFVVKDAVFRALRAGAPALPTVVDGASAAACEEAAQALGRAPWPDGFVETLGQQLRALGAQTVSVRSSFVGEDDADALWAGVFTSRVNVPADPTSVAAAVRDVLASALSPAAVAYAHAYGRPAAAPPVAALVHAFAAGDTNGITAVTAADAPPRMQIQGPTTPALESAVGHAAQTLFRTLGPSEIEWTARGDDVTYLQLRPHRPIAPALPWPGLAALATEPDAELWRWDVAHNPLPLSPAHAGLVELVDQHCRTGFRQRVLAGYLFWAPGGRKPLTVVPATGARARFEALRTTLDARLSALADPPALEDALCLFTDVYEPLLGGIQPAARRARTALLEFLQTHAPTCTSLLPRLLSGVESIASERLRLAARVRETATQDEGARTRARAAYLALFADEASTWDVAAPTRQEAPPWTDANQTPTPASPRDDSARAAAEVEAHLPEAERPAFATALALAREGVALGEDDDWLYARAQAPVRRALLALGARLVNAGALDNADDVFFLPLDRVRALGTSTRDLREEAATGRTAFATARQHPPPLAGAPTSGAAARGVGTAGRVLGRAFLHERTDGRKPTPDAVLIARTLLPTELPLLHVAAFVTETGGPLDHVAAQARERGVPAVVSAAGATQTFRDGDLLLVDAHAGLVVRL